MTTITKKLNRTLGWALVAIMGVSVLNVLWQVFTRFVLSNPSSYTDELARFLLIWIGLLGAAYAAGSKMHLAIDLLPSKLEGRSRFFLAVVVESCVFIFALAVLVLGGSSLMTLTLTLGQTSTALHIPIGYVYLVLPLSGLLIMYYAIAAVLEQYAVLRCGDQAHGRSQ